MFHRFSLLLWRLKTALLRRLFALQDRLRWVNYPAWRKRQLAGLIKTLPATPKPLMLGVVISSEHDGDTQATLAALAAFPAGCSRAWVIRQGDGHWLADDAAGKCITTASPQTLLEILQTETRATHWLFLQAGDQPAAHLPTALPAAGGDVTYFDEDFANPQRGKREPYFFKPDWSPEMLVSHNFLDRAIFSSAFIFKTPLQGATFTDVVEELAWRAAAEQVTVQHVAMPLITRCALPQPAARLPQMQRSLEQMGFKQVQLQLDDAGLPHPTWQTGQPLVSIIIPSHNALHHIQRLLESLFARTVYPRYQVIIMDNNSSDAAVLAYYQRVLSAEKRLQVYYETDAFNYSAYNNRGAQHAQGDLLLFLNNDMEIINPDWLNELVRWATQPQIGAVGAQLLYPDGRLQHMGVVLGLVGSAGHLFYREKPGMNTLLGNTSAYRNVMAVTGACLMTRRDVFDATGGFDENYPLVFNDVLFGLQVNQAGWRVMVAPHARLIHHEGGTRRSLIPPAEIIKMAEDFKPWLQRCDPYFNPNFTQMISTPALRQFPEDSALVRTQHLADLAALKIKKAGQT